VLDETLLPVLERAPVAAVQARERTLELRRRDPPLGASGVGRLPLGQLVAHEVPQPEIGDELVLGVVVDRCARDLHDSGLDRIHQPEVADVHGKM